jgi:hypothetical protein
VANLQVNINDASPGVVASGTCSPGQYWGAPLDSEPTNASAGEPSTPFQPGVADSGLVCPANGDATGMPDIAAQTDELSGGTTQIGIADVADTSPMNGETVYGAFTALAEATSGTPAISLSIARTSGGAPVFTADNVDTANGVSVPALTPGGYKATWTVNDPNGDTRVLTTRFIAQSGLQGPQGEQGPQGPPGPTPKVKCKLTGKHKRHIKCKVKVPAHAADMFGTVQLRISRGARVEALGRGQVRHGSATLTMRERRPLARGLWKITVVISGRGQKPQTILLWRRLR